MFAYNELSDLISGKLVTPIKKDGDEIICLNSKGEEVKYKFEDFDFDKTIEERNFVVDDSSDESSDDISDEPKKEYTFDSLLDDRWLEPSELELIAHNNGYKTSKKSRGRKEFEIII